MKNLKRTNRRLEKEFMNQLEIHKLAMIQAAIETYGYISKKKKIKTMLEMFEGDLTEQIMQCQEYCLANRTNDFNEIYEICWKRLSKDLPDSQLL